MPEFNSENLKGLEQLEDMLLGGGEHSSNKKDEFDRLQELLVKPDIIKMRNQVAEIERQLPQVLGVGDRVAKIEQEVPEVLGMRDRVAKIEQQVPELIKLRDRVAKIEQDSPELIELRERVAKIEQEFPEILELRDRIAKIEQEFVDLESQLDKSQELTELMMPMFSKLLERKLSEFKEEIVEAIAHIVKEQAEKDKTLSIRVLGPGKNVQ